MKTVRVTILAEPGFVPTELALVIDVLRIATRLGTDVRFEYQVCTSQEEMLVEGLGGSLVRAVSFRTGCTVLPDHLVVLGGAAIRPAFRGLKGRLSWMERMGVGLMLLSDAAAEWRGLHPDTDQITTHWENQQVDRDAGGAVESHLPLFMEKAHVATGGGMASTADLVLMRIVAPHSLHLAQSVAHVLLMGDIRDGAVHQPRSENDVMSLRHSKLDTIISAMENALETPLPIPELAEIAGFSVRQMERKFKALIGRSPASYYRSLRLRRAKALVEQTVLPITEISVACGFGNQSSFAKRYIQEFGISPSKRRVQLSVGPYPHHLTSENQRSGHASLPLPPGAPRAFADTAGTHETLVQGTGG